MTNKEFAFSYAGKEFRYKGGIVILVGYDSERPGRVIISPLDEKATSPFWWYGDSLEFSDVITYKTDIEAYQYVNLNEIVPIYEGESKIDKEMTNKEFAFKYAGKEYMYYGNKVVLVGYEAERLNRVIVSPVELRTVGCFWEGLDYGDIITYRAHRKVYQYAQINELIPMREEKPQTVAEVKPLTPGECIAFYEGQQGMIYSVVNGCVSAVYKRQGSALKLVSRGGSINNVTENI